ncbi:hypothetical protein J2Y73_001436 [Peribacillus frigoritolerans]|nr:hypothetical protein [Peribacillus frigoritolerans]
MLVFVIQSYTAVCICHPDNVRIYTVFNTFICNGGVFIFSWRCGIWITIHDDVLVNGNKILEGE